MSLYGRKPFGGYINIFGFRLFLNYGSPGLFGINNLKIPYFKYLKDKGIIVLQRFEVRMLHNIGRRPQKHLIKLPVSLLWLYKTERGKNPTNLQIFSIMRV